MTRLTELEQPDSFKRDLFGVVWFQNPFGMMSKSGYEYLREYRPDLEPFDLLPVFDSTESVRSLFGEEALE